MASWLWIDEELENQLQPERGSRHFSAQHLPSDLRLTLDSDPRSDPQPHLSPSKGPVASCLWVDEELESQLQLDGIVTVVDAKHFGRHLDVDHLPHAHHGHNGDEEAEGRAFLRMYGPNLSLWSPARKVLNGSRGCRGCLLDFFRREEPRGGGPTGTYSAQDQSQGWGRGRRAAVRPDFGFGSRVECETGLI